MLLGKIIKSNSHTDYVCQVYEAGEVVPSPVRDDHPFGAFVRIHLDNNRWLVGLIYDTLLFNPEFGRLGPRLSPEADLAIFSPDYLQEKVTLVGVMAIGLIDSHHHVTQGVPRLAVRSDAHVEGMSEDQIRAFHHHHSTVRLTYLPQLLAFHSPLALHLAEVVTGHLVRLLPEQNRALTVLRDTLAWQSHIIPFQGTV